MIIGYFLEWVHSASVRKREAAAGALVRAFLKKGLSPQMRDDLETALTILLEDNAPTVRFAIAENFGAYACAPRHIMLTLAADNSEIAMVVLLQSPVFHDSELVDAVRTAGEYSQIAISCRLGLSQAVVSAICKHGCRDSILGVLMNPVVEITENNIHEIAERFGGQADIRNLLLDHKNLATCTRHLLIGKLGNILGEFVRKRSWLDDGRIKRTVEEALDRATIIIAADAPEKELSPLVRMLIVENRLKTTFLIRAICMGNITLVANALSELASIRLTRIEVILSRGRESAFRAVYARAGLPQSAYLVFKTAISAWQRLLASDSPINQARLPFIVIREVLEAYHKKPEMMDQNLLVFLRRLAAEAARENSRAQVEEIIGRAHQAKEGTEKIFVETEIPHSQEEQGAGYQEEQAVKQLNELEDQNQEMNLIDFMKAGFSRQFSRTSGFIPVNMDKNTNAAVSMNDQMEFAHASDQFSCPDMHIPDLKTA